METGRKLIITDGEVKALFEESFKMASRIATAHKAVLVAEAELRAYKSNGINSIREGIEGIKSGHTFMVLNAVDENNKPLHGNEAKRASALNEMLQGDPNYAQAQKALKNAETKQFELEQSVQYAKIELETARNSYSLLQSQLELASSLSREQQTIKLSI